MKRASPPIPPDIAPIPRTALRVEEAARSIGLSRSTIYRLMSEGKLVPVKIGGRTLIPVSVLEGLLK